MTDVVPATVEVMPELQIREFKKEDAKDLKEFCLNNLMQRARLSNQYVYRSPIWLGMYLSTIAWATNKFQPYQTGEWGRWAFLCCALSAAFLVGVDYFTYHYYESNTKVTLEEDEFLQDPVKIASARNVKCWVAYYNDGIVGSIILKRASPNSPNAEISHWYVRARYREKGLGGDLLQEAIQHAKSTKCTALVAQTHSINKLANKSLKKSGFTKVSSKSDTNTYWKMLRMRNIKWSINPSQYVAKEE